jgi:hypothetical protein
MSELTRADRTHARRAEYLDLRHGKHLPELAQRYLLGELYDAVDESEARKAGPDSFDESAAARGRAHLEAVERLAGG